MIKKIQLAVFLIILPFLFSFFSYFGYTSAYTSNVFSRQTFLEQFDIGIYKYRILSKYLLLEIDDILTQVKLPSPGPYFQKILKFLDDKGTFSFYLSYFVVNTTFLILSCIVLYLLSSEFFKTLTEPQLFLFVAFYTIVVVLTQFVLVPYDHSAYFFNLLISYFFFRSIKNNSIQDYIIVLSLIFISTLNKETTALSVSLILTIFYLKFDIIRFVKKSIPFVLAFIVPYCLLRLLLGFDTVIIANWRFDKNFEFFSLLGFTFAISTIWGIFHFAQNKETREALITLMIFSIPYAIIVLISGILFEIRLWTPVLINLVLLLFYFSRNTTPNKKLVL